MTRTDLTCTVSDAGALGRVIVFNRFLTQAEVEVIKTIWVEAYQAGLKARPHVRVSHEPGEPEYFH